MKISDHGFDTADTVVIANSHEFADALTGVPLANELNAPLLLTRAHSLNTDVKNEIERLNPSEVIILGGENAVSAKVEQELATAVSSVTRIGGETRFETAELIADKVVSLSNHKEAILVNSHNFPDALSVAPFANGRPIYLSRGNHLKDSTKQAIESFEKTYIIGGEVAVSSAVEQNLNNVHRLDGATRYETNLAVLKYFKPASDTIYVATGQSFADALTGSALAGIDNGGVMLVRNRLTDMQEGYLSNNHFSHAVIFGGYNAVPYSLEQELASLLYEPTIFIEKETQTEAIPFDTVEVETEKLFVGESEVQTKGVNGQVVYTYEDGVEVNRVVVSENVTEPVNEVVLVGTRPEPVITTEIETETIAYRTVEVETEA